MKKHTHLRLQIEMVTQVIRRRVFKLGVFVGIKFSHFDVFTQPRNVSGKILLIIQKVTIIWLMKNVFVH